MLFAYQNNVSNTVPLPYFWTLL